jgi:hypothetical protein
VTDEKATEQRTEERLRRWASSANSRCSAEGSNTTRAVLLVRHAAPPPPQGHPVRALPSSVRLRGGYKTKSAPLKTLSRELSNPPTPPRASGTSSQTPACASPPSSRYPPLPTSSRTTRRLQDSSLGALAYRKRLHVTRLRLVHPLPPAIALPHCTSARERELHHPRHL